MLRLERLVLTDFRNYGHLTWKPVGRLCVITGPNGSGKTNILEAISLLAPGRGLRGAHGAEFPRSDGPGTWAVAARLSDHNTGFEIGTGTEPGASRRVFRLDGQTPRTQADIAERIAAVWLTPQMDALFAESASGRRRFLDRLVWALEPAHARQAASYDAAMASRNRLLAEPRADRAWIGGLEESMARHGVALAAARAGLVAKLNRAPMPGAFPRAALALLDPIAERLDTEPALAVEAWLRERLAANRGADAAAGGATLGAHRADMAMRDATSGRPAEAASTGQQKALLLGVILAHAALIAALRGAAPMLLLDEPLVHLDRTGREALFATLRSLPAHVLMTGTDAEVFATLQGDAEFLSTGGNRLLGGTRDHPGLTRAPLSG